MVPVERRVMTVANEPSPQSTETVQSASEPGSVKEPISNECEAPSFELWSAAAVTLGATLATATICTASEAVSLPPLLSVTLIATVLELGPSGKVQSKLPPEAVTVGVPEIVPCRPHFG